MNHSIAILDLLADGHDLVLVHGPDLIESSLVTLLKSLKLLLKHQEVVGELLVSLCVSLVLNLILGLQVLRSLDNLPVGLILLPLLLLKLLDLLLVDLLSLTENVVIELQLTLIQAEHSLHVLHALLQDLHLFLEFDFLIGLIVGMSCLEVFELPVVLLLHFALVDGEFFLVFAARLEQLLDVVLVASQDVLSLLRKVLLDLIQLLTVVCTHVDELLAHRFDQVLDVVVLLLEGLHILIILASQLLHKALDQQLLLLDDLLASILLYLDVLGQLLAVLLLLELLPRPIDLDVLLVGRDDLGLNLVGSLFLGNFFLDTALVLVGEGVRADLGDDIARFFFHLFQET